jgi:hypothetical protein
MSNHCALLFVTHILNQEIVDRYYRLRREVGDGGQCFFLWNKGDNEKEESMPEYELPGDITPYIFNDASLDKLDYEPIEETIIPGSNHFATLQFFLDYPDFKYYWVIEYDVVYTGHWNDFFAQFNVCDADFLTSGLTRFADAPYWYWWPTLHIDNIVLHSHQLYKSFNPIYRISNRALAFLDTFLKGRKNWGHHEVLMPTVLEYYGFTTHSLGYDELMRYRPFITPEELMLKDKLLHPVK